MRDLVELVPLQTEEHEGSRCRVQHPPALCLAGAHPDRRVDLPVDRAHLVPRALLVNRKHHPVRVELRRLEDQDLVGKSLDALDLVQTSIEDDGAGHTAVHMQPGQAMDMRVVPEHAGRMIVRDVEFEIERFARLDLEKDVVAIPRGRDVHAMGMQVGHLGEIVDEMHPDGVARFRLQRRGRVHPLEHPRHLRLAVDDRLGQRRVQRGLEHAVHALADLRLAKLLPFHAEIAGRVVVRRRCRAGWRRLLLTVTAVLPARERPERGRRCEPRTGGDDRAARHMPFRPCD